MANISADSVFWPPPKFVYDLSLKFEETIFELTPSSVLVACSPFVIAHNLQQPVQVRRSPLLWAKLLVGIALVGLETGLLAFRASSSVLITETTLAAASVNVAAAIAVTAVLYVEHCHSIRSSALLGLYLFIATVFDAVQCRSFFSRSGLAPAGALTAASCGVKVVLLILQEINKREIFIDIEVSKSFGREATAGYWKRMLFTYLNPTFITGFRSILKFEDLSSIGPEFSSKVLHAKFSKHLQNVKWVSKHTLMRVCFEAWAWLFLLVFIPRLCFTGFSFSQPFLLQRIIEVVEEPGSTSAERAFLLCATFLSFAGAAISKMATSHLSSRLVARLRGALVMQISEKNTRLPQTEAKKSAAVTLMSTDIDGVAQGMGEFYELFMTVFDIGIGIFALSRFVGRSCFVVLAPVVLSAAATYIVGDWTGSAFGVWNKSIQIRVANTSRVLGQLKALKMFGLASTIGHYLQSFRQIEMAKSKKFRILEAIASIPVLAAELITPVVVVAASLFWDSFDGASMSAANVFPALSIIVLIKSPLARLLNIYPTYTSMAACLVRIQEFLQLAEKEDPRTIREKSDTTALDEKADPEDRSTWPLVEFVGAKLAPVGSETPILTDVSFSLNPGSITLALGPNGSGKSFLLQSILGETSLLAGTIYITNLLIGFCGQLYWLRNLSIKQNIIGHLPYDEQLFRKVVRCCLLEEDLATLPNGENYVVGSGGLKLSGGQRQRIGLARALFSRISLIVLDDILSSLDRKTATSILRRLCGDDGLLKELNTAVVLTSYLPDCLDVADQLLVLDGQGSVTVEKNFRSGESREKILRTMNDAVKTEAEEEPAEEPEQPSATPESMSAEETEKDIRQRGDLSLYWLIIDPIGRVRMVLWCASMFLVAAAEILPDIYMRIWVDKDPNNKFYFGGYAAIAVVTCLLFCGVCVVLFGYLMPRTALKVHDQMVRTLLHATLSYLGATDNGVLMNRFSQDMSLIGRRLPVAFMRTFYLLSISIIQCGVIVAASTYMAASIPVIFMAIYCIQYFYLRTSRQMRQLDLEARSPLYTHFEETTDGLLYIRAYGWQEMTIEEGYHLLDESQKAYYHMVCIQQWLSLVLGLLVAAFATVLMAFVLFMRESTSPAAVGLSFLSLILQTQNLVYTVRAWTQLEISVGALSRLRDFLNKTPEEPSGSNEQVPSNWPAVGKVDLQNVSARYDENTGNQAVLKDVSLSFDGGQKVAVTGRTGRQVPGESEYSYTHTNLLYSGKSSFFLALLGFLKYTGRIVIDGIDISSIPLDELRSRIVTISQDQIKLNASVRVNLLPFTLNDDPNEMDEQKKQEAKDKDIKLEELLTRLGIWSHLSDKGGLDTMLDDANYSHGEMQLFCLVRGIMRYEDTKSKVILIDEATSSVEEERERAAQKLMNESFPGCTILVIGHRESSVKGVDVTVELAEGEVLRVVKNKPQLGGWAHAG